MLTMDAEAIRARADTLAAAINGRAGWKAEVVKGMSAVGGGSAPGIELPTWLVSVAKDTLSAAALEETLRIAPVPIIARIEQDRVVLDLRTVSPEDDHALADVVQQP
jgi:L-seryl-tRNA(Ser) seleniumtransferase